MKRVALAAMIIGSVLHPIPGYCAKRHNLTSAPGGQFAFWCRTPAIYWLTRSWKIPYRLLMAATGPGGSVMEEKCALGQSSGEIIFDGVLGDGKLSCSGTWTGGGTRWLESCGGRPLTLYLLPEKTKTELKGGFFQWAEQNSSTMFSAGFTSPDRQHIQILKLVLPEVEPKPAAVSREAFNFGGGGIHNLKVCGDQLRVSFEHRTPEFLFDRGLLAPGPPDANSLGIMTFDIETETELGVRSYPLTDEIYKKVNGDLCQVGT